MTTNKRLNREGWIYVVQRSDGLLKIGFTADPERRLRNIEDTLQDRDLYVWAWVPGSLADERWLHRRWAHIRVVGEWFEPDQELLAAAENGRLMDRPGGLCRFRRAA